MNPPWWETRAYRDPAYRYAELARARVDNFLRIRAHRCPDVFSRIGASLAIAGAAAVSRTTTLSLDRALYILAVDFDR